MGIDWYIVHPKMNREFFELGRSAPWWDFNANFAHVSDFKKEDLKIWIGGWLLERYPDQEDDDEYRDWLVDRLYDWIHRSPYEEEPWLEGDPDPKVEMLPDTSERYFELLEQGYRCTGSRYNRSTNYNEHYEFVGDPHYWYKYLGRIGEVLLELGLINGERPTSYRDKRLSQKVDTKSPMFELADQLELDTDEKVNAFCQLLRLRIYEG